LQNTQPVRNGALEFDVDSILATLFENKATDWNEEALDIPALTLKTPPLCELKEVPLTQSLPSDLLTMSTEAVTRPSSSANWHIFTFQDHVEDEVLVEINVDSYLDRDPSSPKRGSASRDFEFIQQIKKSHIISALTEVGLFKAGGEIVADYVGNDISFLSCTPRQCVLEKT